MARKYPRTVRPVHSERPSPQHPMRSPQPGDRGATAAGLTGIGGREGTRTPGLCRVKAVDAPGENTQDRETAGHEGCPVPPDDGS